MTTEQAVRQADLMVEFMRADHADTREVPGPYEQGASLRDPRCRLCDAYGPHHESPCN